MKKYLKNFSVIAIAAIGLSSSLILVSCTNNSYEWSLKYFQSLLWQTTADRRAGFITQFAQATRMFDDIINDRENKKFLDINSVKVTQNVDEIYEVAYKSVPENKYIPIVVMDLDETVLDNTPYQVFLGLNRQNFDPVTWHRWVQAQQAKIYDGVLKFVKHVWQSGAMVFITSNRNQGDWGGNKLGDELIPTRQNLINQKYPEAFLDAHVWWMLGAMQQDDKIPSEENLAKMKNKEQRYNYLNNPHTTISLSDWKQKGMHDFLQKNLVTNQELPKIKVQTIMRIGDDLNDFNDNLTKKFNLTNKHKYLDNKNIENLFGNIAPRISFVKQQNKIQQIYHEKDLVIDDNLQKANLVDEIIYKELTFNPQESYALIAGNSMYGGWIDQYAYNFATIKKALDQYWKIVKW